MNPRNFGAISFPSFGIEIDPGRVFSIGPLTVHYYGLLIGLGLVLAIMYASRRSRQFGLKEDDVLDGALCITPFAILCARAYYCAFSWDQYAANPISVLYIWEGGIAIYGGILGAVLGMILFCRVKKLKIAAVLDLVLMSFFIGQSIGRWGNFFNREAFGAETDSFFRMGLTNTLTGETRYYHPTFLYESAWNALGFVLLHFFSRHRRYDGQVALMYAAWYGLGRCIIEGLRVDSLWWGPFRVSQLLAGISCVAAVSVLLWQRYKPHDPEKLFVNQAAQKEENIEENTEE